MKNKNNNLKILEEISNILQDIFLDNTLEEINNAKSFDELDDWDSLNQMTLGYQLEKILNRNLTPEELESIDMLRVLENGKSVVMIPTKYESFAVDTPQDIIKVEKMMNKSK